MDEVLVEAVRRSLMEKPEVIAAYLYGSCAKGRATPQSDIDVAVLNKASPLLAHEVLKYGILVLSK